MDLDVLNLSDAQLQRLELCLRLGKPADIYLIDEPSAYLNEEEISVAAKVIKNFILYAKKTAFVVETDPDMGFEINDKVILFSGKPASDIIASPPKKQFRSLYFMELALTDKTLGGRVMPSRFRD